MPNYVVMGAALAVGVSLVALLLVFWQAIENRRPRDDASPLETAYARSQRRRRQLVSGLMLLNGLLLAVGVAVPHKVGDQPNFAFVAVWLTEFGLVLAMLVLAAVDWSATRQFARRQREAMSREGLAILRAELERRAAPRRTASNGSASAPVWIDDADGPLEQ